MRFWDVSGLGVTATVEVRVVLISSLSAAHGRDLVGAVSHGDDQIVKEQFPHKLKRQEICNAQQTLSVRGRCIGMGGCLGWLFGCSVGQLVATNSDLQLSNCLARAEANPIYRGHMSRQKFEQIKSKSQLIYTRYLKHMSLRGANMMSLMPDTTTPPTPPAAAGAAGHCGGAQHYSSDGPGHIFQSNAHDSDASVATAAATMIQTTRSRQQ